MSGHSSDSEEVELALSYEADVSPFGRRMFSEEDVMRITGDGKTSGTEAVVVQLQPDPTPSKKMDEDPLERTTLTGKSDVVKLVSRPSSPVGSTALSRTPKAAKSRLYPWCSLPGSRPQRLWTWWRLVMRSQESLGMLVRLLLKLRRVAERLSEQCKRRRGGEGGEAIAGPGRCFG